MTSRRPNLLLVEDDEILGASLQDRLTLEDYKVVWARSAKDAAGAVRRERPDVVVCDIRLPDGDGDDVMRDQFQSIGMTPIVFMTGFGTIDQAVRLVREGAWHYLTKPFATEELIETLKTAVHRSCDAVGQSEDTVTDTSLGVSPQMIELERTLRRVADTDMPVLLQGETGTGKEVAARFLHRAGRRSDQPFVAVNCGAIQPDTAESLILGHGEGAFAGASATYMGFAEEAGGGTLFLDEVGELPMSLQVKLLRLVETRDFRPLGGRHDLTFRGRLVCATNSDLQSLVEHGRFREDLWYRINVVSCTLPPLRERPDDLERFLTLRVGEASRRLNRPNLILGVDARARARVHRWPGNVREVFNRVDRAAALSASETITAADLFPEDLSSAGHAAPVHANVTLSQVREAAEREHILEALRRSEGLHGDAAKLLGISRTTLWEKMTRYGLASRPEQRHPRRSSSLSRRE